MRLLDLKLRHFQGVASFDLDAGGESLSVYGDNGTGKTTLASACSWLLFDKDSLGRSQFDLRPLNADNQPVRNLECAVEGVFWLESGERLELKKVHREVWTKKRGKADQEFSGYTTDHWVNGVPVQQKEYAEQVARVAGPEVFRLLTSPTYFAEQLHWQKRRALLLDVCGEVGDADVIASDPELAAELPAVLDGRSPDDARKVVLARRREVNQELERIPVRVDEATRSLPELSGTKSAAEKAVGLAREADEEARADVRRIEGDGQKAKLERDLAKAESALLTARSEVRRKADDVERAAREPLSRAISEASDATRETYRAVAAAEDEIARLDRRIESTDRELADLRGSWTDANQAACTDPTSCPACGQALPEAKVKSALAAFNQRKAERLEDIDARGRKLKAEREGLDAKRAELDAGLPALREALDVAKRVEDAAREAADSAGSAPEPGFAADPACRAAAEAVHAAKDALDSLAADGGTVLEGAKARQAETAAALREAEAVLARHDETARTRARIAELEAQQKKMGAEFEKLERALWLLDQFTRAKVSRLEARINDRFRLVRFKLFKEQQNGGLEECCEVTVGGVPYSGGLNNGARINAGLDVIRTLSEHFGTTMPVFVDNAEAVTSLLPLPAQMIRLVVRKKDKALRVERDGAKARQLQLDEVA